VSHDQLCRPGAEQVHLIDAIGAGEHPVHQRHHLAARQRRARQPRVQPHRLVHQLLDPQPRVRRAGHHGTIIIRADSGFENRQLMKQLARQGVEFSIGVKQSPAIRALIALIPESDWVTITDYPDTGEAQIAETRLGDFRLIVRRTRLVGAQAQLFPDWRHHAFATNRTVPTLVADVDHRDHAQIELAIRDLKDQALAHFPSGRMHANSPPILTRLIYQRPPRDRGAEAEPAAVLAGCGRQSLRACAPLQIAQTLHETSIPSPCS
jgi:hypothetical protein